MTTLKVTLKKPIQTIASLIGLEQLGGDEIGEKISVCTTEIDPRLRMSDGNKYITVIFDPDSEEDTRMFEYTNKKDAIRGHKKHVADEIYKYEHKNKKRGK